MKIPSPANNWIHEARSELIPPVGNGGFDFANLININAWLFVFKFELAIYININVNRIFLNYDLFFHHGSCLEIQISFTLKLKLYFVGT